MSDKTINREEIEQIVSIIGEERTLNILGSLLISKIAQECHVHLIDSTTFDVLLANESLLDNLITRYNLIKGEMNTWKNGIVQCTLTIKL